MENISYRFFTQFNSGNPESCWSKRPRFFSLPRAPFLGTDRLGTVSVSQNPFPDPFLFLTYRHTRPLVEKIRHTTLTFARQVDSTRSWYVQTSARFRPGRGGLGRWGRTGLGSQMGSIGRVTY